MLKIAKIIIEKEVNRIQIEEPFQFRKELGFA